MKSRPIAVALAVTMMTASPTSAAITVNSNPILYWNDQATTLFVANAGLQTRGMAMANIAMHDAVNSIVGQASSSYLSGVTSYGGDTRAAVAQAAHDVLVQVNPANAAQYDAALSASLAGVANGAAKVNGVATGAAYAAAIVAARTGDGSANPLSVTYASTGLPGDYRVPGGGAAAIPFWGDVKTFILSSGDDLQVAPPPALSSDAYAAAYNEVKAIGSATNGTRTADQTNSGLFWDVSNGTTWVRAGLTIAEDENRSTLQYAEAFGRLTTGLADALITGFDSKYDERLWRPITAIQLGDTDGNAATIGDPTWASLFPAPAHPSYVSTHSALSAAAAAILLDAFGDESFGFSIGPDSRNFTGIGQAAQDAADSRLWGGIHFRFDNEAGAAIGQQVGARVLSASAFAAPVPEPSTWAMMLAGFLAAGTALRSRRKTVTSQAV